MPERSKVNQLPPETKAKLDTELVRRSFSGYEDLAEWLASEGFQISKSSLGRYGKSFEDRLGTLRLASEQARAIVAEMGDDAGDMGEALTAVAQQKTFELLMQMDVDPDSVDFDKVVTATAKLNSTGVQQKKWRADVRKKLETAAAAVEARVAKKGLDAADVQFIRREILGVVG